MFPLIGSLASNAMDFLAGLQSSQTSSAQSAAAGFLSRLTAEDSTSQPAGSPTPYSATASNLSPAVLAFLIQHQGAHRQGSASSQAASLNASSEVSTESFRSDFEKLLSALNGGDLAGVQQAYAALMQLRASDAGSTTGSGGPLSQALDQIGQELQSGDLAGAQQTMASLQQQLGAAQGSHHRHHHGAPASDRADAAGANPTSLIPGEQSATDITSSSTTNSDGSTTTTLTYPDGSKVTLTSPAASTATPGTGSMLETLIRLQAQLLGPAAAAG